MPSTLLVLQPSLPAHTPPTAALLLSPVMALLIRDDGGAVISKRNLGTLEVTGLGMLHSSPGLRPVVQAMLFPGMAIRKVSIVPQVALLAVGPSLWHFCHS